MKFITKYKKIFLFASLLFLMIITFGSIVYTVEAAKTNEYEITPTNKVYVKEVWINGSKQRLKNFSYTYNLSYDEETDILLLDKPITVELSNVYEFNIIFAMNDKSGSVTITDSDLNKENLNLNQKKEDTYCYVLNKSFRNKTILKNYLKNDFKISHLIIVLLSGLFYLGMIKLIKVFIVNLKNRTLKFKHIMGYFLGCIGLMISTIYILLEVFRTYSVIIYIFILAFGLWYVKDSLKDNLHYLFLYLFIPIGILFALVMPIGHVPDETDHFYKSHIISNRIIMKDLDKDGDYCINANPSLDGVLGEYNFGVQDAKYTLMSRAFYKNYLKPYSTTTIDVPSCHRSVSKLYFVAYFNTTVSLIVSKALHLPVLLMFILGRLTNFMFYIFVLYYCIKTIPKYKKALFIAGTLPIAIQSATAFNQDCVHNAMFFLLFTQIIKAINSEKPITIKEIGLIVGISVILSLCKLGYFPLIFLCLLIPKKRFESKKSSLISKMIMILPIIISFIITYLVFWRTGPSGGNANADVYSIFDLFTRPFDFIRLYIYTIKESWFYMLFQGLVDGFAYSTKYNSTRFSYIIAISYALMLFEKNKDDKNDRNYVLTIIVSSAMICLLIMTSMLGGNSHGAFAIGGLQARYFIPVALLGLSLVNFNFITVNSKNKEFLYGIIMLAIYFGVFNTIISGFYV